MAEPNRIVWTRNDITPNLNALPSKLRQQISKEFQAQAPRVESYAKRNAPWKDRTGAARNGLTAEFVGDRFFERQAIRVFHTVPYGIFLEVKNAGKYAVIVPTIVSEGDRIMGDMRNLLGRITGGGVSFSPGVQSMGLSI
jgi:hypothetical protein